MENEIFSTEGEKVEGQIIRRMQETCDIDIPKPCGIIIFGASGDLTHRKIIPALYHLYLTNLLPTNFFVLGCARTEMPDAAFRSFLGDAVKKALPKDYSETTWSAFSEMLYYTTVDYAGISSYGSLSDRLRPLEKRHDTTGNRIFYLAVPPTVYETVLRNLGESGLAREAEGYGHIVIEKPIGRDLESARRLNVLLKSSFQEKQVYRMDHYLAKETVQNILMFRFANAIFEPLWNRRYIDHIQITASETLGVEHRSGYYEKAGVIRDMFQNHIFQLLALTAMEPPVLFEAERVRDEKIKVFQSIRPFPLDLLRQHVVLGQYGTGVIDGREVAAYRDEPGVSRRSAVPTFAAMKVFIDNWRWNGVPFYLRSGKRLLTRKAEISIHFRPVPHMMFSRTMQGRIEPNTLVLRIQPDEGIGMSIQAKNPGSKVCLNTVLMNFAYQEVFILDAYERVLLDCMQADQMLFIRSDGIEQTWALLTPVIERLEEETSPDQFPNYAAGTSGPSEASALIENDGRAWRPL